MLASSISRNITKSFSRNLATLSVLEEFPHVAVTPSVHKAPVVKESTLANGVRIVSCDNGSAVANVRIAVVSGSRAETWAEKGAAHLLSKTAYTGTGLRSGLRLVRDLDNAGARYGSSSDREKVVYEVSALTDKLEEVFAAVGEAVVSPSKHRHVLADSKSMAARSYKASQHCPYTQIDEMLHEAAYGERSPLGSSIYAGSLDKVSLDSVLSFREHTFKNNNLVVAASGVSHEQLQQLVECHLHGLPAGNKSLPAESPYKGGEWKVRCEVKGGTYVGVAFPMPGGANSVAYKALYNHLATAVNGLNLPKWALVPFVHSYSTGGIFGFYARGSAEECKAYVNSGIVLLKSAAVGSGLEGAVTKTKLDNALALDGENSSCRLLGNTIRGVQAADVKNLSAASVAAAAKATLSATPSLAVLGTTYGAPTYAEVKAMMA